MVIRGVLYYTEWRNASGLYTAHSKPPTMSKNPLIPLSDDEKNPAVELIRAKVERAYGSEPDAVQELAEVQQGRVLSKHQRYMQELSASGKSLAEIQTEWHRYYVGLPDQEKHEVWQEFYAANQNTPYQKLFQKQQEVLGRKLPEPEQIADTQRVSASGVVVADHGPVGEPAPKKRKMRTPADQEAARELKGKIANQVSSNGKLTMRHHLQSLGFGLASGFIVLAVLLFTFFNEYIIAPFIQPSRTVSSTPIIVGDTVSAAEAPPSVTVPKINIQIPIDFSLNTYDETTIENSLKSGAIHYPNTVMPGQNGNAAYFGHSSGNIFNNGKYKFAFTLLHDLTTGDLFYINYQGKTYAYRIFEKQIVPPTAVSVITDTRGKQATAELITCDPPGISTNRLVVWGEQISPSPTANAAPAPSPVTGTPPQIAGNGPTLWNRLVNWAEFWN
jgi:LPXTG-site transpeptidase (sortase) family protein